MKRSVLLVFSMVFALCTLNSEALNFNPFKRNGRIKASSVIVTGNYVKSRLLAELAQYYSKQPLIVVSPDVDGSSQLFFMPATNNAVTISADEFLDNIDYVNPKRVIILGGDDFVPKKFTDQARAKYSVVVVDSNDWEKNAISLGEILKVKKLDSLFNSSLKNIEATSK